MSHLLYVNFVGWRDKNAYQGALNQLLTKGFGLPAKPPSVVAVPPAPPAVSARTQSLPSWLVPVVAVAVFVVVARILVGVVVNGIVNSQPSVTPTRVVATAPTTIVPTVTLTNTPTMSPEPADTVRPPATFTPKPTDTPRPTAVQTFGIGSSKISPIDGATMLFVPAGEFAMGSNVSGNEELRHPVYLDVFWIDRFGVTNPLYKKCVDAGKCSAPLEGKSYTRSSYYANAQFDNYPVVYISWEYATKFFCAWAGKQLPTEAQWEKAGSWDDSKKEKRLYPWGNTFDKNLLNSSEGGKGDTTAVGSYPGGASSYIVMDMAGNVWEWVADWYAGNYYKNSPARNPRNETVGQSRVMRGGSWLDDTSWVCTARRGDLYPDRWNFHVGFRCVE